MVRGAKAGKLSVVTSHGRPVFVAVPLDEHLLENGVHVAMAAKLYDDEVVSLGKAAKLAGVSIEEFIEILDTMKIPVVRYDPAEIQQELSDTGQAHRR